MMKSPYSSKKAPKSGAFFFLLLALLTSLKFVSTFVLLYFKYHSSTFQVLAPSLSIGNIQLVKELDRMLLK